jgi:hypothetical protein
MLAGAFSDNSLRRYNQASHQRFLSAIVRCVFDQRRTDAHISFSTVQTPEDCSTEVPFIYILSIRRLAAHWEPSASLIVADKCALADARITGCAALSTFLALLRTETRKNTLSLLGIDNWICLLLYLNNFHCSWPSPPLSRSALFCMFFSLSQPASRLAVIQGRLPSPLIPWTHISCPPC